MNKKIKTNTMPLNKDESRLIPVLKILAIPIVVLIIITIIMFIKLKPFKERYYQYIDFQDEFGIANECFRDNGIPICIDKKGVVIMVKMYADITEEVNNAK